MQQSRSLSGDLIERITTNAMLDVNRRDIDINYIVGFK